ncbi:hypothetical protein Q765_14090 [Flavobacterium rivuli WB 3.3-2 = DSM 21788]|uniref:Secretion system C-terminal sorting domain-containing protein n=1 Tax=Flavobacterium rivuli WB 3.3-2 = DSM 21788 TaxID=1121895 RepID=A0A0A2MBV0_9FLAO|nr:T9SS type A sorting domain-containing protein [Flavobacterium rivuli]KGO85755.1 hypothetical protein Q765_14090 [Flavobacterium rivuli WB 3.3-2 = DSM 21788]
MKITLRTLFFGSLLSFGAASAQTNQPLTVTSGYNADVIANGTGAASASTTSSVDNANYAFMSTDFRVYSGAATYSNALPVAGLITSQANSAITFQLAPLTGNNVLRLQETSNTGTLEFSNQLPATKLYVMATGGSGSVTITTIVNFTDGTSQTVTGGVIPDWFYSTTLPIVKQGIGRVSRGDNGIQNDSGEPRIYMYTVDVATANQAKYVSSIQFTKTSAAEGVLNVFGVTALQTVIPCTIPDAPTAVSQNFCGATTASQLTATGAVTDATYRWYTTATGGTPLAATTQVTSGIHYVSQIVGTCESTRTPVEIEVTIVPQPEGATTQYFCAGATVADIQATGVTTGTVTFTFDGQPIATTEALRSGVITATQTIGECSSDKLITINIGLPAPDAPAEQRLCNGSLVGDFAVTAVDGATVQWTFIGFISQPVALTARAMSGRYSVVQTIGDCSSISTTVIVTVEDILGEPGGPNEQEFTAGETVADLLISVTIGNTITWYVLNDESLFVEIPNSTVLEDGVTYFVTQSNGNCISEYHPITVSNTAGLKNIAQNSLLVYPNPANGIVTIQNSALISQIVVNNILGQHVITQRAKDTAAQVNIASLPAGTYIIQVTTAAGTATARVIKQ